MIRVYKHERGSTQCIDSVDPAWLRPGSSVWVWVDLDKPTPEESRILTDVFHFHELAVEDALAESHHPKIESYGDYLYLILHGINFRARDTSFKPTTSISFSAGNTSSQCTLASHDPSRRSGTSAVETITRSARARGPCCTVSWMRWWITTGRRWTH